MTSGVALPQSSILCPLYFLLYITPFPLAVFSHSKVKLFSDDVTVCKEISSPDDVTLLQFDLPNIAEWAKKRPMKCDDIVISNKHSPPLPAYHMDFLVIISHHPVKHYPGVWPVGSKLNWNEHCIHTVRIFTLYCCLAVGYPTASGISAISPCWSKSSDDCIQELHSLATTLKLSFSIYLSGYVHH